MLLIPTPPEEPLGDDWVKAEEVLTNFSAMRSFISGDGLPRVEAKYRFNAAQRSVRGTISFGPASEGMPGFVHGGAISGVFDEGVGLLSWYLGVPVVTKELIVRFRRFVPINSTVHLRGSLQSPDNWIVHGSAEMTGLDGTVHAAAEASFVELDEGVVAELAAKNASRALGRGKGGHASSATTR